MDNACRDQKNNNHKSRDIQERFPAAIADREEDPAQENQKGDNLPYPSAGFITFPLLFHIKGCGPDVNAIWLKCHSFRHLVHTVSLHIP